MINLKKLTSSDISLLIKWFKMDHIREYWDSILNLSDEKIYEKYYTRLNKDEIEMFIILKNSKEIGYIQTYILESNEPFLVEGLSKGIDLFIGDANYLNKGFGTEAIKKLIIQYVFDDPFVLNVCIDPEVRNKRAIRAYEKVGFTHTNTAYCKTSKLLTYYMVLKREDFFANL